MSHQGYSSLSSLKKLRACTKCHLVKTEEQFLKEGCDNCKDYYNKNEILSNITQHFKGIIAITNPKYSWAAKWLKKQDVVPGFYCLDIIKNDEEDEGDRYEEDEEDNENRNEYEDEED